MKNYTQLIAQRRLLAALLPYMEHAGEDKEITKWCKKLGITREDLWKYLPKQEPTTTFFQGVK